MQIRRRTDREPDLTATRRLRAFGLLALLLLALLAGRLLWLASGAAPATLSLSPNTASVTAPGAAAPYCPNLPALVCLENVNPSLQQLSAKKLGSLINQSQERDGISVKLALFYLDDSTLLASYVIRPPAGFALIPGQVLIQTGVGVILKSNNGSVARGMEGEVAFLDWFDATGLEVTGPEVKLHFELTSVKLDQITVPTPGAVTPAGTGQPPVATLPTATLAPASTVAAAIPPEDYNNKQSGPLSFSFDFNLPFSRSRILMLNQSVSGDGVAATLEKIVPGELETVFFISGVGPEVFAELTPEETGRKTEAASIRRSFCHLSASGLTGCGFEAGLLERPGQWKLVIRRMAQFPYPTAGPCNNCAPPVTPPTPLYTVTAEPPGGPWIFHFSLP